MTINTKVEEAGFAPASRISTIGVSQILKIGARAQAMKRDGKPVIILGAGEPDFDTPDHVKQAACDAIQSGKTKYTALDGTPELKQAIRDKFSRENGVSYELDEITVATGAKQILFNAMMATLNPGDEVIIPTPYWTSYSDIVEIAEGRPVLIACDAEAGFRLKAKQLEAAITPKTRWVMLNSPSNPSGAAYSAEDYRPLLDVLLKHPHVWLLVDDMYEHIVYDGFRFVTPAALEPALKNRTLTVNGVSKAYAMTGWRIGYAGGPRDLIKAMAVVQSQATSCPSSISQAASVAALNGAQDFLKERTESFQRRRDLVVSALNAIEGLDCRTPEGAFYTFSGCAGMLGKTTPSGKRIETDADFCAYLLDDVPCRRCPRLSLRPLAVFPYLLRHFGSGIARSAGADHQGLRGPALSRTSQRRNRETRATLPFQTAGFSLSKEFCTTGNCCYPVVAAISTHSAGTGHRQGQPEHVLQFTAIDRHH